MHSRARLTYTQVWDWLSQPKARTQEAAAVLPQLENLYALYKVLAAARARRGAIDFETIELRAEVRRAGQDRARSCRCTRNDAHRLIEECMLAANVCAADFLLEHEAAGALPRARGADAGEARRAAANSSPARRCRSAAARRRRRPTTRSCWRKIKGRPDFALLQTVLLRSLQQAVYSPDNVGHFGLALRRLRALHLADPPLSGSARPSRHQGRARRQALQPTGATWAELGVHCSQTERRADDATRDVENWLKCFFMQDQVGEIFDGHDQRRHAASACSSRSTTSTSTAWCTSPSSATTTSTSTPCATR